jgi:phosphatidate cytidylyltransferase
MNLFKRLMVAALFIPILLFLFWSGGVALASFLALISLLQVFELKEMFKKKGIELPKIILPITILVFFAFAFFDVNHIFLALGISVILLFGNDLIFGKIEGATERIGTGIFSLIYSPVFLSSVYKISEIESGRIFAVSLLILLWITDSFAYFTGMLFGKHRNVFKASPKKSAEGFIGGIFFAFLMAYGLSWYFSTHIFPMLLAAFSASVFGQTGDLFESVLKRDCVVKDSSNLLPGHGGILDRFDSLLIAAPVFYVLLQFFG